MAGTTYPGIVTQLRLALSTAVATAAAAGLPVQHTDAPFKPYIAEDKAANSTAIRHTWFKHGAARNGALAQGTGPVDTVQTVECMVQYPSNLTGIDGIVALDLQIVKARLEDTAYQGWPDSGLMNVRHTGSNHTADEFGRVTVVHTLTVRYLALTF